MKYGDPKPRKALEVGSRSFKKHGGGGGDASTLMLDTREHDANTSHLVKAAMVLMFPFCDQ